MEEKFLLRVNQKLIGSVFVDTSKLRDKDLGRREIIKTVLNSSELKRKFLKKEIVSVSFSLVPIPEINLKVKKVSAAKRVKEKIVKKLEPILKELQKGNTRAAEKKTAKLILFFLKKFKDKKIKALEISDYFETLWWSEGFIEKIREPLNSAVLEGADLNYFYEKGKESSYHLKEFKRILNYLKNSAEEVLKDSKKAGN